MMECDEGMWQRQLIWVAFVSHSVVSSYLWTPWTVAHQSPLSMGFSRQEYWSQLPFPSPGDFPNPGIELGSLAKQGDSLRSEPSGKPSVTSKGGTFKPYIEHWVGNSQARWGNFIFILVFGNSSSLVFLTKSFIKEYLTTRSFFGNRNSFSLELTCHI